MDEQILNQMGPQRFGMLVLAALGTIAVLLTILGTYVLAASMASARRREMSIRAALGANRGQLAGLVLGEALRLVGAGVAIGLFLAWAGAGTIRGFLYQVEPLDAATLSLVSAAMVALTLLVCAGPAVRTARVDLARVLRED
jgi:ABC-type antimicrobial peptide transport system permease subunit